MGVMLVHHSSKTVMTRACNTILLILEKSVRIKLRKSPKGQKHVSNAKGSRHIRILAVFKNYLDHFPQDSIFYLKLDDRYMMINYILS